MTLPTPRSAASSVFTNATIPDLPLPTDSTASVTASANDGVPLDYDAATATHYHTLGVTADASPDEIRRSFRALALRYHPDQRARRRGRRQRLREEELRRGDGSGPATDAITSVTTHAPSPSESASGAAHRPSGADGVEAVPDGTGDDAGGNEQLESEGSPPPWEASEHRPPTAVTSVDDDDIDEERSYEDGGEEVGEGGDEGGALAFRWIQEAYGVLRCDESRESYDARLRREAACRDQRRAASSAACGTAVTRVALSEMECEVCEVVSSSSDGEDDGNGDGIKDRGGRTTPDSGEVELEKVYTYPCRCGDDIEVMESELPQLTSTSMPTPTSTDVGFTPSPFSLKEGRTGPGGCSAEAACSASAVFQCRSCSLSVWIDLAS